MKKLIAIFIVLTIITFTSCKNTCEKSSTNYNQEKNQIKEILQKVADATAKEDIEGVKKYTLNDENYTWFGTSKLEQSKGWESYEEALTRQFEMFDGVSIAINNQIIDISDDGNTAWFSEFLSYSFSYYDKKYVYNDIRYTGVLKKIEGNWKIVQTHMSITDEVEEQSIIKDVKSADSLKTE